MASIYESGITAYNSRQRVVSLTIGLACSVPLTSAAAMANVPVMPSGHTGWQVHASAPSIMHNNVQTFAAPSTGSTFTSGHAAPASFGSLHHSSAAALHASAMSIQNAAAAGSLNLASARETFVAGNIANFQTLTIDVGGKQQTVNFNSKLTAAELVAAEQVLSGAGQTIKLNAAGVATGGSVTLDSGLFGALNQSVGGNVSSLTIARGVQVIDSLSLLSLTGSINNYGSLLTASGAAGASDTISANTIYNARGGEIGSYNGGGGLYAADPILNALTSFSNSGSVSSAGNLTINAPVVYNVGYAGSLATITSAKNVNINTQTLDNTGVIAALTGNVNVASNSGLNVVGGGGTISAVNGNINMSATDADLNIDGGNLYSQQVNLATGKGNITADMEDVTGVVNASGCDIKMSAATDAFKTGAVNATGDPLIVNSAGDVQISAPIISAGAPISIVASGNILSFTGAGAIDSSSALAAGGGPITLVAGASFTGTAGTGIQVTKASASGGLIDLAGGHGGTAPVTAITSAATGVSGNGGAIQMIAFAGKNANTGTVTTPGAVTIDSTSVAGNRGDVTIVAGAKTGAAIVVGKVAAGVVVASASTPVITLNKGSKAISFDSTGLQSGGTFGPGKAGNTASISFQNVDASSQINVLTAGGAAINNTTTALNLGTITVGAKANSFVASNSGAGLNGGINIKANITGGVAIFNETNTGVINSGLGSVNTTSLTLNTGTAGKNTLLTNVSTLAINSAGSSIDITQGVNTMALSGGIVGAGTLNVVSSGQINVTGLTKVNNTSVTLQTATGSKGGISIAAPISVGTGTVTLNNLGKGVITETVGNILTAKNVNIETVTNIGSKTAPFLTNSTNLDLRIEGAKLAGFVSDLQTGILNVADASATGGGSLTLNSAANQVNVGVLPYATVSITDTAKGADIQTTGPLNVGTGAGVVTVVSAGTISNPLAGFFKGTTVSLTATNGVGTNANPVFADSANLALNSSAGNVFVTDNVAATVNGAAGAANIFTVTDGSSAPTALTVGKSVGGGNIQLITTQAGSGISVAGTLGTASTSKVGVTSTGAITTKGAISGSGITLTGAGLITIGGAVGTVATKTVTVNGAANVTVGGLVSGNVVDIKSANILTTTKGINGTGALSTVTLTGGAGASGNAIIVGGAITGEDITLALNGGASQGMALNANIGTTAGTSSVTINDAAGAVGISGKGVLSGLQVNLTSLGAIGTAKANINIATSNLSVNNAITNLGGVFITQKGTLLSVINNLNTDNLSLKVTGNLDIVGNVTAPLYNVSASGALNVYGTLDTGKATANSNTLTSGTTFAVQSAGNIVGTGGEPVTIKVGTDGTINGNVNVSQLTLTTGKTFTVNNGGKVDGAKDSVTAKGGVTIDGQFGNATDIIALTSGGILQVGFNHATASITGASGSASAVTLNNYGTISGDLTLNASGSGNLAFNNYNTVGSATSDLVINASKGNITAFNTASVINGNTVKVISGGSAVLNVSATTNINSASVKGAMNVTVTGGTFSIGGATVADFKVGSLNTQYTPSNATTLTVSNIATSTGDLTIASGANSLQVVSGVTLSTLAGNITLLNTTATATPTIKVGNGVLIHGSGAKTNLNQGNVYIIVGAAVPSQPYVAGTIPAGVPSANVAPVGTALGTTVFFGTNSITSDPAALFNGLARNLVFSTGVNGVLAIQVGSSTFTADPPADAVLTAVNTHPSTMVLAPVTTFSSAPVIVATSNQLLPTAALSNSSVNSFVSASGGLSSFITSGSGEIVSGITSSNAGNMLRVSQATGATRTLSGGVSNASGRMMERGVRLIAPEQNTVVSTPFGSVSVAADSVALIVSTDNGLAVYNLHDARKNAVVINDGGANVALNPGRCAFLTNAANAAFEDINPAKFVAYRQVANRPASNGGALHQADFEIMSLVRGLPGVKELMVSDSPRTRKTMVGMLKTAAILMQLTQGGEAYSLKTTPAITAYAGKLAN